MQTKETSIKRHPIFLLLVIISTPLLAFQANTSKIVSKAGLNQLSFSEVKKDFPRVEKNLRKWDAPTVVDLDQDGYLDLILNDHGLGVSICWNNKGKFAKPYDLIMGDLHGVSAGDFDMDGNIELIISRGGGSGSNARNSKMFRVDKKRNFKEIPDFKVPLELMRGRTVKFFDGDNDGDLDLINFAFPDKDKKGASENYIYENDGKGELILETMLPPSKTDGQKTLLTDFNGDSILDLILYGQGDIIVYQGDGRLQYKDVTNKVLSQTIENVNGIAELDYDNDGDFDLYLTRGKDFEIGETFYDEESKIWGFFTKRGAFRFDDLVVGDVLQVENFQSQWPDNDAFHIGETGYPYEFEGETHSGKDMRIINSDALGYPDNPSERGTYIGFVGNRSWRISGHLWAPATGIVRNVESYAKSKHPAGLNDVLLENIDGKFTDVTTEKGLDSKEHTTGVAVADFDNNGFVDLIVLKRGDLIHENESLIFLNKSGNGFEYLQNHRVIITELGAIGMAVETLDYNKDGRMDVVIGNERGKWHLFRNELNNAESNKYLQVNVGISPSGNSTALGAIVTLRTCDNVQVKRIGNSGANYSQSFDNYVHFGLVSCDEKVNVQVQWTNGEVDEKLIDRSSPKIKFGKNE